MASEQDCIDALREAARELGASPTKAEYEQLGLTPASATIIRTIGGWNDAKEQAGLATNVSTGSRVGPPPEGVDDDVRERWAELSVDQRWHYRNREWNTERTLNRRAELQSWVDERSADAGCARCGESAPACLDFHHRDPGEKSRSVSRLIVDGVSRERLREEMEKCTVLCANCHRKEHDEEP
ncbi:HNH endonuclease [Halolamina sp. CBA1230]|uniref:homing endonuclease associated repeat-containing protein n=1 Tax=Halolamina sp. CBA1230 TaxID=1853690 RepID=UPI0009A1BD07|nr:HNH endonuclease [Halolamina sp. CBA1230]QKY21270.1 HNH endonuclease [Halolamina sp. CBA1230]